jgi:hypothetical protein
MFFRECFGEIRSDAGPNLDAPGTKIGFVWPRSELGGRKAPEINGSGFV